MLWADLACPCYVGGCRGYVFGGDGGGFGGLTNLRGVYGSGCNGLGACILPNSLDAAAALPTNNVATTKLPVASGVWRCANLQGIAYTNKGGIGGKG